MTEVIRPAKIIPYDHSRDFKDLLLLEIDRFDDPLSPTLANVLINQYGTKYWKIIDISDDGRMDAYILAGVNDTGTLHIFSIAVRSTYEGNGLATKLIQDLIVNARREDINRIELEVNIDNNRARNLYTWLGFEEVRVLRDYYRDGQHALKMRFDVRE